MPKLKQPTPLLAMASDVLLYLFANYCHKSSVEGSLDKLRRHVAFVKDEIGPYIPWEMAAGFYEDLLYQFLHEYQLIEERPESHKMAMFEVIMDRKLVGLRCSDLELMDVKDAHRLQGLQELKMTSRRYDLGTFHLEDLTVLVYYEFCTDSDLQIIGRNCSKLRLLDVTDSRSDGITDNGLLALRSCSELRDVRVIDCHKITDEGVKSFLAVHGKIQNLYTSWSSRHPGQGKGLDCFSHPDSSVYPSITQFVIDLDVITDSHLRCVTEKFPNLISLLIYGDSVDSAVDFCALGSLDMLSNVLFRSWDDFRMDSFKPVLKLIGANIQSLTLMGFSLSQGNLNFLYKFCPKLECLHCCHTADADGRVLVVPPFKRLQTLGLAGIGARNSWFVDLQFGIMSNLGSIVFYRFEITTKNIESIILDKTKFPNLTYLALADVPRNCDIVYLEDIVKNKNIDFEIDLPTTYD